MRPVVPWLLTLLGLCTAAQAGPRELIDNCARQLPTDLHGLEALEPVCPGLTQALTEASGGAPLAALSLQRLDRAALIALLQVTATSEPVAGKAPDPAAVGAILQEIEQASAKPLTWWDRVKAWWKKWLSGSSAQAAPLQLPAWLTRLSMPAAVIKGLLISLLVLLAAGVAILVRDELRLAGVFSRTKRPTGSATFSFPGVAAGELSLEQVLGSDLAERPALLFRLLVAELVRQGRLAAAGSLTHREVAKRAQLDDAAEREQLTRLSDLAEYQLFGQRPIIFYEDNDALLQGQSLYLRLRRQHSGVSL